MGRADTADVTVVTSGHDVADARLHRHVAALQAAKISVRVIGLGDSRDGPDGAITTTLPQAGFVARAARAFALPWRASGVVITLDPDVAFGAWLRRAMRARIGRRPSPFISDVHEDYVKLLRDRAWASGVRGAVGRVFARLGAWATARADGVVAADDHLVRHVKTTIVVKNLPDPSMLPAPSAPDAAPRAVYVGDLRKSRGLFAMIDAIQEAPGWTLDLVGPIAERDHSHAQAVLDEPAVRDRVRWHGRLPPREAWRLAEGAWVGLLLLEDTPAFREAIPTKLYEYLQCGLAVVATDLPRTAALITDAGAGVIVRDADEAAAALRGFSDREDALATARANAAKAARGGSDYADFVELCRTLSNAAK